VSQKSIQIRVPKNHGTPIFISTMKITLPSSKSISNRLLILQALSDNAFCINDLSEADDTQILHRLLAQVNTRAVFDCGHGGTTMRFLTAYLALRTQTAVIIMGSARLCERPIHILVDALRLLGADINYLNKEGFAPLRIAPARLDKTAAITMDSSVSSQYISALLLIAPALPNGLQIRVSTANMVSLPYLESTIDALQTVGYAATMARFDDHQVFGVSPKTNDMRYPNALRVPADWSSATYFFSAAALKPNDEPLELLHLQPNATPQADEQIRTFCAPFLAYATNDAGSFILKKCNAPLPYLTDIDCTDCPDLAQTLVVLYAAKRIKAVFRGLKTLRIKETDRIAALQTELAKVGVQTESSDDTLRITDFTLDFETDFNDKTIAFATYNDHRMAMAFSVLRFVLPSILIANGGVVSKSFPNFWKEMKAVG
jgi:3-phosphoshikimate 1-carboxyvinyltransferase